MAVPANTFGHRNGGFWLRKGHEAGHGGPRQLIAAIRNIHQIKRQREQAYLDVEGPPISPTKTPSQAARPPTHSSRPGAVRLQHGSREGLVAVSFATSSGRSDSARGGSSFF